MKTALEVFIEDVEEIMMVKGQLWWHERKQKALKKEKEQIEEAYDNGIYGGTYAVDKDGEEYYKEQYDK